MNRLTVTLLAILAMSPLGGRLGAADSEEFLVEDLGVLGAPVDSTVSSDKSRSEAFSINSRGYIAGESTIPVEVAAFTHGVAWAIPVFRGVSADGSGSGMVRAVGN